MFRSVNELDKFLYDDCQINEIKYHTETKELVASLEALIVGCTNSQNTNYTESYADTAELVISGAVLESVTKVGFKYYNTKDELIKEIPDEPVAPSDWAEILRGLTAAYLVEVTVEPAVAGQAGAYVYTLMAETTDEIDGSVGNSYELKLVGDESRVTWDRYLNRVQR